MGTSETEPSKLAQARLERDLTQPQVAEYAGVDVVTVSRWERGVCRPHRRKIIKLCTLFGKSAQELGLALSEVEETEEAAEVDETPSSSVPVVRPRESDKTFASYFQRDIELRLQYCIHDWMLCEKPSGASCAKLQSRLSKELEENTTMNEQPRQNHESSDLSRRDALRRLALIPIKALSLDAIGTAPRWAPEDLLPYCAAGITACEQLSKGISEDMGLASQVLTTYLPPLQELVEQSSLHRKEAARLVAQALKIKAVLSVHREGPKRAISYGKQAAIFARESGNIPLRLTILKRLAWLYACDKQEQKALEIALQAKSLLEKQQKKGIPIHPTVQSALYGGVAKFQAYNGQDEEALNAIHDAKNAFFTSSSENTDLPIIEDYNYSTLLMEDGITYYHLGQYEKALDIFAQAIDPYTLVPKVPTPSERVRIEIINNATLASLKRPKKDMGLSIKLWTAGIQGAIDLRSEQRYSEALEAYSIMQALWSGEKRFKELRDLRRHW